VIRKKKKCTKYLKKILERKPWLHLFDQKYSKNINTVKDYKIKIIVFYFYIFLNVL